MKWLWTLVTAVEAVEAAVHCGLLSRLGSSPGGRTAGRRRHEGVTPGLMVRPTTYCTQWCAAVHCGSVVVVE